MEIFEWKIVIKLRIEILGNIMILLHNQFHASGTKIAERAKKNNRLETKSTAAYII